MNKLNSIKDKVYIASSIAMGTLTGLMYSPMTVFAANTSSGNGSDVLNYDISNGTVKGTAGNVVQAGNQMQTTARQIYWIISAIALIIVLANFVFKAVKLSKSGDNPQQRQAATEGLIHAMIAIALIGGAVVVAGWMVGILKSTN